MQVYDVVQGSPEWAQVRLGIPTSSDFKKVMTPTGLRSSQDEDYAHQLIAELLLREPLRLMEPTHWMERGQIMELEAAASYEMLYDAELLRSGFVTDDQGHFGCSPDRFVDEDGLLEIKCPAPNTHVGYLLSKKIKRDYMPQLQGQLHVTGRKWVDIFSYHPEMPPARIRVERDEKFQTRLRNRLKEFRTKLNDKIQYLIDNKLYDPEEGKMAKPQSVYMAG